MKDAKIYKIWCDFINDDVYKEYFLDNNTIWLNNLEKVRKYIDQNNKRPSMNNNDYSIKTLGAWINTQQYNYKSRKYIIFHDTTSFEFSGMNGDTIGLWPAIEEFMNDNPHWIIAERFYNNNGLTILKRI